ncbi:MULTISPECIES: hypothetical protein [Shewanella]|uniref:hypothetical protein n=1 Tax=Shewanella TaxID=22 RepID=UPI00005E0B17|nr:MULTISPECIES: hypothetical protein [unclassified Shewanella]ABK48935.1 conserved hypothetical protein [Shewanella sp. ANA-3]MDH0449307.1 hypothetical protein [Shewanella sp. GD04112]
MSMVSAKEFAHWLKNRFEGVEKGVSLTREDINQLTGRQNFSLVFVHDIHYELMRFGIAFVTDTGRDTYYLVRVFDKPWRNQLEQDSEKELFSNVVSINLLR